VELEENLFGVEHGEVTNITFTAAWDQDGNHQRMTIGLGWRSRKMSYVTLFLPDELQLSHFVAIWMPILMNGQWLGKKRVATMVRKALERSSQDGAEVVTSGGSLPRG
jgi:hypothetical protein